MTVSSKSDTTMKSNSQAPAAATAPEYTPLSLDGWSHSWNVVSTNTNLECMSSTKPARAITDYYHKEECGAFPRKLHELSEPKPINRSYPRHHALVLAARCSSSKLVSSEFPFVTTGYERGCSEVNGSLSRFAYARVHDDEHVTPFTELTSTHQKNHLTSLSGMTGLLVVRLLNRPQLISSKTKKKHAEITKQYLHSALATEYLIGNRYYRNLMMNRHCVGFKHPVGFLGSDVKSKLTAADITPDAHRATQDELRKSYNANIDRLLSMIEMFKRGFVSIDQIREDPEFVRMMTAFWRSANQTIKMKEEFENQPAPPHDFDCASDIPSFEERKEAKRVSMIARIAEPAAIAPMLYQYDVTHLFDNQNQSYSNYVKMTKHTWARLANDGSTASFLAFAAIEPQMVTGDHAPQLGGMSSVFHGICLKSCANYVPTRHPVFGSLRMKHRCHILRTADALNISSQRVHPNQDAPLLGVSRDNKARFRMTYAPMYYLVEETTRPELAIDVMRKFPETHQNTGKIISAAEAEAEFKERVYTHGMASCTPVRRSMYDDDYYSDCDYDDDDYYDDNDIYDDDDGDDQYPCSG
jgi:hypothetical protein